MPFSFGLPPFLHSYSSICLRGEWGWRMKAWNWFWIVNIFEFMDGIKSHLTNPWIVWQSNAISAYSSFRFGNRQTDRHIDSERKSRRRFERNRGSSKEKTQFVLSHDLYNSNSFHSIPYHHRLRYTYIFEIHTFDMHKHFLITCMRIHIFLKFISPIFRFVCAPNERKAHFKMNQSNILILQNEWDDSLWLAIIR